MVRALTKDLTNYALEFGRSTTDPASTLLHNVMEGGSDSRGSCNSSIQENVENEEGRVLIRKKSISPIIPLRKIYSLLVVDDSKVNRRMLTKALGFAGHIVVDAGDGDEAVDLCNEALKSSAPFDAILLDCNMPRMNGIEAASLMRQAGFKGFIIGVTGNGMEEDVADFMSHGADAVIVKPMDLSKFQSTMESLEGKVVQTLREKETPVSFNSSSLL